MSHRKTPRRDRQSFRFVISGAEPPKPLALALLAVAMSALTMPAPSLSAATFRVTTKVYEGASSDATAEHLLLFDQGLIYDFPQIQSRYITVYDPAQSRVTLLDRQTQVQTTLRIEDLIEITAQARAAAQTPQQQEQLGLNVKVQRSDRVDGYAIRFGNLEYHVTTQRPSDPTIAADFARFADLASRLNLVRRMGPPPFGRMALNQYLASRAEMPRETTLSLRRGTETQEFRSAHLLEELDTISPQDRRLIEEARGMLAVYRHVEIKEFP